MHGYVRKNLTFDEISVTITTLATRSRRGNSSLTRIREERSGRPRNRYCKERRWRGPARPNPKCLGPLETTKVIPFGKKRLDDAFIARNGGSADPWLSPVTKESKLVGERGRPGIGSICSRATPRGDRLRNGPDNEIHKIHRFSRIISFLLLYYVIWKYSIQPRPDPLLRAFSKWFRERNHPFGEMDRWSFRSIYRQPFITYRFNLKKFST